MLHKNDYSSSTCCVKMLYMCALQTLRTSLFFMITVAMPLQLMAETIRPQRSPLYESATPLPLCVDREEDLKKVADHLNANKKTKHKYDIYRELLKGDSDLELLSRLVYAETLAANCPQQNQNIVSQIVSVIGNRINLRKGDVKSVVFQRDQFSSSLNRYESSRYKDFLCPKDAALWKQTLLQSQKFLESRKTSLPADSVNYFLYKHDPRWPTDPWNLQEDKTNSNEDLRTCLRVFHVPGWQ
jgi:hypothetical protein